MALKFLIKKIAADGRISYRDGGSTLIHADIAAIGWDREDRDKNSIPSSFYKVVSRDGAAFKYVGSEVVDDDAAQFADRVFNSAGDSYFDRHDLGHGWVFDLYDDGSAAIANAGESRRIDLAPENIARLRGIIHAAQSKG